MSRYLVYLQRWTEFNLSTFLIYMKTTNSSLVTFTCIKMRHGAVTYYSMVGAVCSQYLLIFLKKLTISFKSTFMNKAWNSILQYKDGNIEMRIPTAGPRVIWKECRNSLDKIWMEQKEKLATADSIRQFVVLELEQFIICPNHYTGTETISSNRYQILHFSLLLEH